MTTTAAGAAEVAGAVVEVLTNVVEGAAEARRQEAAELEPEARATAERIAERARNSGVK